MSKTLRLTVMARPRVPLGAPSLGPRASGASAAPCIKSVLLLQALTLALCVSMSVREGFGNSRGMDALPAELWPCIIEKLPNSALCSLSASNKACWRLSCYKRTLKVELQANQRLHSRLVSLLYFLTSRREHLGVCCMQS